MADPPRYPDTDDDVGVEPDPAASTGTSRWQKVVGILGILVVLWLGSEMYENVTGDFGGGGPSGGQHGPGQNTPVENQDQEPDADDGGGHTPGPPAGGHG